MAQVYKVSHSLTVISHSWQYLSTGKVVEITMKLHFAAAVFAVHEKIIEYNMDS